ncbi:HEAT repeat protein [Chitinophaga skermanii]|uniref:HEAT repeat protein n=1 Tax=Chitinophaga skermanii TaxID=331697 RepID=A0A327PZM1_9BACT|nr:HEAT repeat domain-containing protein [Chitinophaga skermanii]RAI97568.1 HEAT repeat protein [Chitinophaga skermanii]
MNNQQYIDPEALIIFIYIFGGLMVCMILLTFIFLRARKKKWMIKKQLDEIFDNWLGEWILEDLNEDTQLSIPPTLVDTPGNAYSRQYAVDQLINTKKNLIGIAGQNTVWLYEKLGLKKISLDNFHSRQWFLKAKGIYELYMMEQKDMQDELFPYTNSSNEYVRTEAQTAILAFEGFEGLRFFNTLTHPITNWQQIKLMEQLRPLDPPGIFEDMPNWLQSSNPMVVQFALKLAGEYQQFQVLDCVYKCLGSEHPAIREQAIIALVRMGDETSASAIIERYNNETKNNKQTILRSLYHVASTNELPFLLEVYETGDGDTKLLAARAIAHIGPAGMERLAAKGQEQPEPYEQIYLHIKSEIAR